MQHADWLAMGYWYVALALLFGFTRRTLYLAAGQARAARLYGRLAWAMTAGSALALAALLVTR